MSSSLGNKRRRLFWFCLLCLSLIGALQARAGENDISIDFVDADIADVIRVLAASQNMNYIIGNDVTGKVTIKLDNVSFNAALQTVITANGYGYRITENVLHVNTVAKLKEEEEIQKIVAAQQELVTFVFELKYISAVDVIPVLENELSDRGKIFPLKRTIQGGYRGGELTTSTSGVSGSTRNPSAKEEATRTLIVMDIPSRIEKIQDLIIRLDKLPQQVLIDTKIVEMTMDSAFDFGIRWDFLAAALTARAD
jgi:type IV pilus assembly protein PilQ